MSLIAQYKIATASVAELEQKIIDMLKWQISIIKEEIELRDLRKSSAIKMYSACFYYDFIKLKWSDDHLYGELMNRGMGGDADVCNGTIFLDHDIVDGHPEKYHETVSKHLDHLTQLQEEISAMK